MGAKSPDFALYTGNNGDEIKKFWIWPNDGGEVS